MKPEMIKGGAFTDSRGTLQFVNDFQFRGVQRFYQIIHPETSVVRAWQGHKVEHKWFYVSSGSFVIAHVKIDDWNTPSANLAASHVILSSDEPCVLSVPPGYANGIKARTANSILTVFSNLTVDESSNDRWSFSAELWVDWLTF